MNNDNKNGNVNESQLPVMFYLHGFMSGHNGAKQRQLQKIFKGRYIVEAPELDGDIVESLRTINTMVAIMEPEIIIGTSLGGFMAMMCESGNADVVVVNPVTNPRKELARWLNQEQTYFCERLDGVQTYTLTKDVLHKYADYKFDRNKKEWGRQHLAALCSTADELLGDTHVKVMREMANPQLTMVVDDFGHQCRDAGMTHLKELLEKVIARREQTKQACEDVAKGELRMSNGITIGCALRDTHKDTSCPYRKDGTHGVMHEHARGAAGREFYKILHCLADHGEEVFFDGSKFLCPVPITKAMEAAGYDRGLSVQVTLGQYIEWWTTEPKALDTNGNRILTFTDIDECTSIDHDGNLVSGTLAYPADDVWHSFLAINSRYVIAYHCFKHYSIHDLLSLWLK